MKTKRRHERSIGSAIGISVLTALVVGIVASVALLLTHYSVPRLLYELIGTNQSGELEKTSLYLQLRSGLSIDDLFVTGISLLISGIALGLVAPSYTSLGKKLGAATASSLIFIGIFILGFQWGAVLIKQHGHIYAQQLKPDFLRSQGIAILGWVVMAIIGAAIGHAIQRRKRSTDTAKAANVKAAA